MKNPKSEIRNSKQYQITKTQITKPFWSFEFGILNLFRISILGFSILIVISHCSLANAAPIITNEELVTVSDDHAIITCHTTNEPSIGGIKWGMSATLGNVTRENFITNHHYLVLNNLYPNTTYYYKVFCQSGSGTTESTIKSFTTLARPSGNFLFTFATITDLHAITGEANTKDVRGRPYARSEAILAEQINSIKQYFNPAFLIIKGDVMDDKDGDSSFNPKNFVLNKIKPILDSLGKPYYLIPGNHDKYITSKRTSVNYDWVTDNLKILYPSGPSVSSTSNSSFNYSFTYGGYRFIMLDSSTYDGVTAEVNISSLEAELNAAKTAKQKAFIFLHHEVSEEADIPNRILAAVLDQPTFEAKDWDKIRIKNYEQFFNVIRNATLESGEPVVAGVFMGHIHDNRQRNFYGIPFVRTASSLQFPTGFNIYKVYSNGYIQSFYKLPGYSEGIARNLITGTEEVSQAYAQQFYLGGGSGRNFTFTYSALNTSISPTIESTQPLANTTGVALNQPIIITFTKQMATLETQNAIVISPDITGKNFSWNNSNTRLTIFHDNFNANTNYTITIGTTAKAIDNTSLGASYTFSFTTGTSPSTTAPKISIDPIKNEAGEITNVSTDNTPTFTGIATDESGSTISNIEFRYSSGTWSDWQSTTPLDGTFDSSIEAFTFAITREVLRGEHSIEVRATNSAGVTTTTDLTTYNFWVIGNQPEISLKADGSQIISGDPINPSPSFEITVVTDRTLAELWLTVDNNKINIKPSNASFITKVITRETFSDGVHNVRVEAIDIDSQGNTRFSTKEAVNLIVQTTGDTKVFGTPLNYPNPFSAGTENTYISYVLSRASNITLTIHDLAGNLVAKKNFSANEIGGRAGYNEIIWDGKSDAGDVCGNGIYVYLIVADGKLIGKGKLTVLKR